MVIVSVGADGRTDRRADVMKLIVFFRSFAKARINCKTEFVEQLKNMKQFCVLVT